MKYGLVLFANFSFGHECERVRNLAANREVT